MTTARSHALYRFYDTTGALLYVGITLDPGNRWRAHRDEKPWWHQVTSITLQVYPDRDTVLAAEQAAIIAEHPLHNIVHNRGRHPARPSEFEQIMLTLVGADPFTIAWGIDAAHMPDMCHDHCAPAGDQTVYYPHFWHAGRAHYTCIHRHHWTCHWGHQQTGAAPQNYATRQDQGANA